MNTTASAASPRPAQSRLWRPPIVGIITLTLMLFAIALGHAGMIVLEDLLGPSLTYKASIGIGFVGILALWTGIRSRNENFATWVGFLAGLIVWMSWVEFFYAWFGRVDFGLMPRMDGLKVNGVYPEYMIMTATVGVLMIQLAYYIFDKDTRCNMFVWIQKHLGLKKTLGPSTKTARDRNYAIITFMETVYVTWFCYAWNLLIFDPAVVGIGTSAMVATFGTILVSFIWGGYCFSRLLHYRRTSSALRYAIPTANILWVSVEIATNWNLFTEIWVKPQEYAMEVSLILAGFMFLVFLIYRAPKKPSEIGEWQAHESR